MKIYLVGGAVRDMLLQVEANDRDFVIVDSTQAEVEYQLGFSPVGKSFPVYLDPKTGDEYALARRERKTGVGYNGFAVDFGRDVTLAEDLYRRDLTINAIAYDPSTNTYVDPYNGRLDLENRVLRHVSPAFVEDPLRVIRLARFYARYSDRGFAIHFDTVDLARSVVQSGELDHLPDERHWAELKKVFDAGVGIADFFVALWNLNVLNNVRFYKDLLGTVTFSQVVGDYPRLVSQIVKAEVKKEFDGDVVAAFVALATGADKTHNSPAIPTNVKELSDNLWALRGLSTPTNAAELLAFLSGIRAWSNQSVSLNHLLGVMRLAERVGEKFTVSHAQLRKICDNVRLVKPVLDRNLTGTQIGQTLKKDRLVTLKKIINHWHANRSNSEER